MDKPITEESPAKVNVDVLEARLAVLLKELDEMKEKLVGAASKAECLESLLMSLHGLQIINLTELLNEARVYRHVANVLEIMVREGKVQDYRNDDEESDEESEAA